jgi:hypothetical protein
MVMQITTITVAMVFSAITFGRRSVQIKRANDADSKRATPRSPGPMRHIGGAPPFLVNV